MWRYHRALESPPTLSSPWPACRYVRARQLSLDSHEPKPHRLTLSTQVSLGIATLLYFVPTSLASSHQAGSLTLLTLAVWLMHELRRRRVPRII